MIHKLVVPFIILTSILHAIELGIFRPMPEWVAYFGLFGSTAPNALIGILLAVGSFLVIVGRYHPEYRNKSLSRLGKEFIAAGFGLLTVGRLGWLILDVLGSVPQPPPTTHISQFTYLMYTSLYAAITVITFALARREGCDAK